MTDQPTSPTQPTPPRVEKVIAVRLKQSGKLDYFNTRGVEFRPGDWLVVETSRGLQLGQATTVLREPSGEEASRGLRPLVRKATPDDIEKYRHWEEKSSEAVARCKELAQKLGLKMKPMAAHYNLDGSHLTIYFSAGERVDFRDLVKELRQALHARVELRQVGPRDEAKLIGAIGKCGRRLCCMTFIDEFQPISIRMAKDQDLSLNPMKVSGVCGRLLCCLGYEAEHYRALREKSPRVGQEVSSPHGKGRIISVNPFTETALLEISEDVTVEAPLAQLSWEKKAKSEGRPEERRGETGKGHQPEREHRGNLPTPPEPPIQESAENLPGP
ncbi:MAG: regulatory iron-sulfur-containing complex subunit RicT [Chloroflexota bacterium]